MGLRPAASVKDSDATNAMAPALTEPLVVNQKKLTTTSPTSISTTATSSEISSSYKSLSLTNKATFQLAFEKHLSDGPNSGPLIDFHMDQENNKTQTDKKLENITSTVQQTQHTPNHHQQSQQLQQHFHNNNNINNNNNIISSSPSANTTSVTTTTTTTTTTPTNSTMGLQKERDKENAEMEQMLGELASTSDIDLLQVFKSLESAPTGDGLCDLTGGLSLFNDVDVMNMCSVVEEVVSTPNKDTLTVEIRSEIEKVQLQMERKCDFLLRRLRKIQSRHMGQHISEEVGFLYSDTYRLYKRKEREHQKMSGMDETTAIPPITIDKFNKPVTPSAMKTFLKKINHVSATQSASLAKLNQMLKTNYENSSSPPNKLVSLVPRIDDKAAKKIEDISGMLQTELRMIETAIDSDATASSSGGESADEAVSYNNQTQEHLSIAKRAAWRWARDRAAIASRWSWLLAQISDLEYRIRQHNELHNHIKKHKGMVTFEDVVPPLHHPQQTPTTQQSVNGFRGVLPGNTKPLETDTSPNGVLDPGTTNGSSRTRPFQRNGFRKRKLLQTVNLHTISKKAARPSTLKCGCQWPVHPCALCTGRQDPTAPRDLPDMIPASERVALLDPCFHPVLSFPEDVSHSIHLEAITRLPEWQNKALRSTTKTSLKGALAAQKAAEKEDRSKKFIEGRRKISKKFGLITNKLKKSKSRRALQGVKFTHLIKHKHRKVSGSHAPSSGSDSALHQLEHQLEQHGGGGGGGGSGSNSTPRSKNSSPTPMFSGGGINKSDRIKSRSSYDIDNIIIPYSVAASTRVELLPYKEIPTPKWRIIEEEGLEEEILREEEERLKNNTTSQDLEEEDISDEIVLTKHERALQEERRKFQTFLKFPWSTRSRANRRTDSRAESSGANTPDPTSPAPNTPNIPVDQESIPSPANPTTPLNPLDQQEIFEKSESNPANSVVPTTSIQTISGNNGKRPIERRRTVSIKINKDRDVTRDDRSNTPDVKENPIVPPYEPLEFPLDDNIFEDMINQMPPEHKTIVENCIETMNFNQNLDLINSFNHIIHDVQISTTIVTGEHAENAGESDDSESIDSIIPEEDPNDPEWQSTANLRT